MDPPPVYQPSLGMIQLHLFLLWVMNFPVNLSTKDKVGICCKLDIAGVQIVACDYDSNATSSTLH
jgi:hypothetical protein